MAICRTTGYDRMLHELRSLAVDLGIKAREHVYQALRALCQMDIYTDFYRNDDAIDEMRDKIVNRCFDIMSLQQLRNQDLRWLLGYQRMAQELERVADYACDLAEICELVPERQWPEEILRMGSELMLMVDETIYILKGEKEITRDLCDQDDHLDEWNAKLQKELIRGSRDKTMNIDQGLSLVVARTLERMGDHVVNVAEMLLYVQTGRRRLLSKGERHP